MVGALWTGISGLQSHQKALDNESSNIANVNTVGYKASRISFADQMYQDQIGKGSKVYAAEKLFTQGNLKSTGVSYDMALSGDGFFTVKNTSTNGSAETLYTRAGNFKMGETGTLQDAVGNEILGWAMSPLTDSDIQGTNPDAKVFDSSYSQLGGTKIIELDGAIETITAKMTDYTETVKSDNEAVFTGAGYKTDAAKMADIQELANEYSARLDDYAADPEARPEKPVAQVSVVNFPDGAASNLSAEGDQIYVVIDGTKISQSFIDTTATVDYDGSGAIDATDHLIASQIATYKGLADQISNEIPGMTASTVYDSGDDGAWASGETLIPVTDAANYQQSLYGMIQIESLIPGREFEIGEVAESSSTGVVLGTKDEVIANVTGSGSMAVETLSEALKKVVSGAQRTVIEDEGAAAAQVETATFTIWDPELTASDGSMGDYRTITADLGMTDLTAAGGVDAAVTAWNAAVDATDGTPLSDYATAYNINDNLVIVTNDKYVGYEYKLSFGNTADIAIDEDKSGMAGAGAEYLEITTTVNQKSSHDSLQLQLDKLGISDSAFGEFEVDSSGVITMKQDGVTFAIGQVAIAQFSDQRGLEPKGDNLLAATAESGDPIYKTDNEKTAKVEGGQLELSTADLSESLVNLMVYQRAFEANAKSITTSDTILNTLINLKK